MVMFSMILMGMGLLWSLGWAAYRLSGGRTESEKDFVFLIGGVALGVFVALISLLLLIVDQGIME